jgi:hypothetical protein
MDTDCTCYWTDPSTWFVYYGAVEPGSQMEPNPDCPVHFGKGTDGQAPGRS